MQPLADAVRLRVPHLRLGMFDIVQGQLQPVVMGLSRATELCAEVSKDSQHTHALFLHEGCAMIEQVCRGKGGHSGRTCPCFQAPEKWFVEGYRTNHYSSQTNSGFIRKP